MFTCVERCPDGNPSLLIRVIEEGLLNDFKGHAKAARDELEKNLEAGI